MILPLIFLSICILNNGLINGQLMKSKKELDAVATQDGLTFGFRHKRDLEKRVINFAMIGKAFNPMMFGKREAESHSEEKRQFQNIALVNTANGGVINGKRETHSDEKRQFSNLAIVDTANFATINGKREAHSDEKRQFSNLAIVDTANGAIINGKRDAPAKRVINFAMVGKAFNPMIFGKREAESHSEEKRQFQNIALVDTANGGVINGKRETHSDEKRQFTNLALVDTANFATINGKRGAPAKRLINFAMVGQAFNPTVIGKRDTEKLEKRQFQNIALVDTANGGVINGKREAEINRDKKSSIHDFISGYQNLVQDKLMNGLVGGSGKNSSQLTFKKVDTFNNGVVYG